MSGSLTRCRYLDTVYLKWRLKHVRLIKILRCRNGLIAGVRTRAYFRWGMVIGQQVARSRVHDAEKLGSWLRLTSASCRRIDRSRWLLTRFRD